MFCAGAADVFAGCVWPAGAGCVLAGCCDDCDVSGGCCAGEGLVCCARSSGAEHKPAISKVLRILEIRCCTVIKTSGNFWFFEPTGTSLFGLHGSSGPGKYAQVVCCGS